MKEKINGLQKIIGSKIREFRTKKGLTQEELASKADLHTTFIAHIESGKKVCSVKSLKKIASALKIPIQSLFTQSQKDHETPYDVPTRRLISMIQNSTDREKELVISIAASVLKKRKN